VRSMATSHPPGMGTPGVAESQSAVKASVDNSIGGLSPNEESLSNCKVGHWFQHVGRDAIQCQTVHCSVDW
jgi:hypothetical protein